MDQLQDPKPNLGLRRLIASLGIIVFLFGYVVVVSDVGRHLPQNNVLLTLLYYALAGTLWGVPVLPLISWSGAYKKSRD
jgi:hypothetical protein